MRVLIVGGGGLGTVLAGYLARAGVEVTLFVKPSQQAAFTDARVHITGLAEFDAPVRVTADPSTLPPHDYLLVCVKGRDSEAALAPLRSAPVATVLSLQNGVAKDDLLVRLFGRARVLGALTGVGGSLVRPGHARHTLVGPTLVGELDGGPSPRGEALAAAFVAAGLPSACVPDIRTREWHKLAVFLRTALVCALLHTDIGSALLDPDLGPLCARIAHEAATVAAAEGAPLWHLPVWPDATVTFGDAPDAVLAALQAVGQALHATGARVVPSLAQDAMAGRPTELEHTAGDVLRRAARHGLDLPSLAACYRLLRARERRWKDEG
jgi:2-dehydropantoate 2-reductase